MTTPDFVLAVRQRVGHDPLWLSGVSAVTVRGDEVLLVRRSDNGSWGPVAGIIEPGEHPADTAARESAEEAGVEVVAERLAGIDLSADIEYANEDRASYLVVVMRCRWIAGTPHPVDGEAAEARWVRVDELDRLDPPLTERVARRIRWAREDGPGRFLSASSDPAEADEDS